VKVLRAAFNATMKDPAFLKEAEKAALELDLVTSEETEQVLRTAAKSPPEVINRVKTLLGR
jgi:tripartite-type tricarboxylate transporter receptor subunit TctC